MHGRPSRRRRDFARLLEEKPAPEPQASEPALTRDLQTLVGHDQS